MLLFWFIISRSFARKSYAGISKNLKMASSKTKRNSAKIIRNVNQKSITNYKQLLENTPEILDLKFTPSKINLPSSC